MQRNTDKINRRKILAETKTRAGGVKKNLKSRGIKRFQAAGQNKLKFIRKRYFTKIFRQLFGRETDDIIPAEMKQPGMVPIFSIYKDTENRQIILRCDSVEYEDEIVTDENGKACFKRNTAYRK